MNDTFASRYSIVETTGTEARGALVLNKKGEYFIFETTVSADGYYNFEVSYCHDCYELITRIRVEYPDGNEAGCVRGLLTGRQILSLPIYLKAGKNKICLLHSMQQEENQILPLYIFSAEICGKADSLSYEIAPKNLSFSSDNPRTLLTFIKSFKDNLTEIKTQDGASISFSANVKGETLYTEAMLDVYLDKEAVSKLRDDEYELLYCFESGRTLSQKLKVIKNDAEYKLQIINFNVGAANSTLIKLPNGKNMLVDSGRDEGAEKLIIPYLEKNGIKLDYYLLTHFHLDHYGLKDKILEMNGIKKPDLEKAEVLIKAGRKERAEYLSGFGYLDSSMLCRYDKIDEIWDLGGVKIDALNSRFDENGETLDIYQYPFFRINEHNYENSTSVSFMLDYNEFRYYHGADNYAFAQETYMYDMIKQKRLDELSCHWYYSNHHFICDISPQFIKTLNPAVVYITNTDNTYLRATYNYDYKKDVEENCYYNKRLCDTLVCSEVGSAVVYANSGNDWRYETICDEEMYK